jgi:hypothetical protein
MKITATVTGQEAISRVLKRYRQDAADALAGALYMEAEKIMTAAKELTPVDTGTLRDSGTVLLPRSEGPVIVQELGFGGPAAPYAVYVHENLQANHPVGQAKFLEVPFTEAQSGMEDRIATKMKQALGD